MNKLLSGDGIHSQSGQLRRGQTSALFCKDLLSCQRIILLTWSTGTTEQEVSSLP